MSQRLLIIVTWIAIVILSLTLRLQNLEERPIHADEATGARILAGQLAGEDYQFDPQHFHGPLLSLSSQPIARSRSETSWSELSTTTLRLSLSLPVYLWYLPRYYGDDPSDHGAHWQPPRC